MTRWWPVLLLLLPGGCLLAAFAWWRRRRAEEDRTDLVPRWAAFIKAEPRIPPAKVPEIQTLKAHESEFLRLVKRRA